MFKLPVNAVGLIVLLQSSFLGYLFGNIYYVVFVLVLIYVFLKNKEARINYVVLFILLIAFLSILANDIPSFFRPTERFISFLMVILLVGPLISSAWLMKFRMKLLRFLNTSTMILVSFSFVGFVFNLNFVNNYSGFCGFYNSSIMLGAMSAISLLCALFKYFSSESRIRRLIFIIVISLSFLSLISAGSRLAIVSLLPAILFLLYKRNSNKFIKFFRSVLILVFIGIVSFPLWKARSGVLVEKVEYGLDNGDLFVSRTELWNQRVEEFLSSPFIGIGFASVDVAETDHVNLITGSIEPGSSWLVVMSMIGVLGFVPLFVFVFNHLVGFLMLKTTNVLLIYLGTIFLFFIFHMVGEGYVFSSGSGLFVYMWLLFGVVDGLEKNDRSMSKFGFNVI